MNRDNGIPIDEVERSLLLEAYDQHPTPLVVERRKGQPETRHVAALKLEKKGLFAHKSVEASASATDAYMRTEYALTDPGSEVARVTGAN